MQVEVFTDPRKFARQARPVLVRAPEACNLLATQVARAIETRAWRDHVYALVHDGGELVGVAMHAPTFNLLIGPFEGDADAVAAALIEELAGRTLAGVTGESASAGAVARAWARATGRDWTLRIHEVLYVIYDVPAPPEVPGNVREVTPADGPWLTRWLDDFHAQVHPYEQVPGRTGPSAGPAVRRGGDRTMLLWVTGSGEAELPVSVAGVTAPQSGVARIGPVYTPAAFRGHGYAAAVTAAGTARAFLNGASRVMLYADRSNPTSNGVYRRLGFRPLDEAVLITFT